MLVKLPSVGEMAAVGHIAPQLHLLLLKAVLHSNYNSHSTCITEGQRQVLLGLTFSPDNPQSGQPKHQLRKIITNKEALSGDPLNKQKLNIPCLMPINDN